MNEKFDDSNRRNYNGTVNDRTRNAILKDIYSQVEKNRELRNYVNSDNYRPKLHCCIIPEICHEQKKRASSDSMLYSSDTISAMTSKKYFAKMEPEGHVNILINDKSSNLKHSGYDFCTWLSVANPSLGNNYEKQDISSKSSSVTNKCLKLTTISPSSPKKSPKDYWLLKHNSTYRNDKSDVFTFDDKTTSAIADHQVPRRMLTTIMDNSPESEEFTIHQGLMDITNGKTPGEIQCLKHKKYLQNKYQQQSSSSMESDDVFLETEDIPNRKEDAFIGMSMDCCVSHSNDNKLNTGEKMNTSSSLDNKVTFSVFTFPPHNEVCIGPCLSESESGLLSPAGLSSIASSPGVVSSPGTFDNCPISISLEKFALNSDARTSNNNFADTTNGFSAVCSPKDKSNQNSSLLDLSTSAESHSKPRIMPLRNATYHDLTTSGPILTSNVNNFFTTTVSNNFLHSVPMIKVKSEDGLNHPYLIQSNDESDGQAIKVNTVPLSTFKTSMLHVIKSKSLFASTISSPHSSSSSDSVLASDLLKDISVSDSSRNHTCQICERVFSRSDMLSRHMRLHTGQRPYECITCGQVFSRSDHLQTHLRTHTGEKPYRCSQCLYAAPRRDMVTRHMRVHARGKTRKGKRSIMNGEMSLPCHHYIIIDEKCITRSKPMEHFSKDSVNTGCIPSPVSVQESHSKVVDNQINSETMKSSILKSTNDSDFGDIISLSEIPASKPLQNHPDCIFPLDLSNQLNSSNQPKSTSEHLVSHLSMENVNHRKLNKIAGRKSQKSLITDVSLVKSSHVTEVRYCSSSVTCSPMTHSDSTVSIDSGVSYATPSSLIQSISSPDSPGAITQGHEPSFFLWPTVVHGSPG